uniref:NADH-ubiquinone oxidoreductase chain 2 n=1 Tax=Zhangixalus dennysi TaxID=3136583 RepID=A0A0H3UN17_9NEOB|nr:NADH dehydrogenase subunit 2 [Rhacophorus dennysi]AIU99179.1 NADH dehydrogenase subunit 2 [Rhacophorus dennysi]ALC75287.1 NADH dehydrogenase subunit 2 [Rhacophorus dennysi]ARO35610.1 NADH dehydrogenase subunit 2 [Rhacophorus dennysi]UAJ48168.1 NADH dehydrogenase subunit 2 [Rhacophorus sp.]
MNPLAYSMFISSLAMGTTITMSSHHWILAWIGLEINTLAIIPIMMKNPHPRSIEAATKYFLTQATASALILFSALMNAWASGEWCITTMSYLPSITLSVAIMMKLGLAPLHFWMPEVLQGISLSTGLILSTWQKIAPMTLLLQLSQHVNIYLMTSFGLLSILIGGWGGVNQTQMRKIMAFSSIGHLGWMILVLKFNPQLTEMSFMLYIIMTAAMFLSLISTNSTKMTDISNAWSKTPTLSLFSMMTLLSLAGLPPLTGFTPKLLIVMELVKQNTITLASVAMLASLLALFFYLRLTYVMIMIISPNTSTSNSLWKLSMKTNTITALTSTIALVILPMTPTMLLMM